MMRAYTPFFCGRTALLAALAAGAALGLAGCGTPSAAPRAPSTRTGHAARSMATPTAAAPATTAASGTVKPHKRLRGVAAVVNGEAVPMWEYRALLTLNTQAAG